MGTYGNFHRFKLHKINTNYILKIGKKIHLIVKLYDNIWWKFQTSKSITLEVKR